MRRVSNISSALTHRTKNNEKRVSRPNTKPYRFKMKKLPVKHIRSGNLYVDADTCELKRISNKDHNVTSDSKLDGVVAVLNATHEIRMFPTWLRPLVGSGIKVDVGNRLDSAIKMSELNIMMKRGKWYICIPHRLCIRRLKQTRISNSERTASSTRSVKSSIMKLPWSGFSFLARPSSLLIISCIAMARRTDSSVGVVMASS